jgi:hypothetical protein
MSYYNPQISLKGILTPFISSVTVHYIVCYISTNLIGSNNMNTLGNNELTLAHIPRTPTCKEDQELKNIAYNHVFEYALDYIAAGTPLTSILQNDPRNIDIARLLRWIKKNPTRNARFIEAQEIAAEIMVDKADTTLLNEDLAVDARKHVFYVMKFKAGSYYRAKFGNSKQLEVTSTVGDIPKLDNMSSADMRKLIAQKAGIEATLLDEDDE